MFINMRIFLLLQIIRIAGCYFTIVDEHILKGIGTFPGYSSEYICILHRIYRYFSLVVLAKVGLFLLNTFSHPICS